MTGNKQDVAAEIARLRSVFATYAESLVTQWLPAGKREGHEWVARNPTRADGSPGSFKINLRTGAWSDFATGDSGGDVISLRAYLNGNLGTPGAQIAAAKEIAAALGVEHHFDAEKRQAAARKEREARLDWREVKAWEYHDVGGDTVFEVVRFEATTDDGKRKKRFVQRHRDADGKIVNGVDGIEKVPYRLPELLEDIAQERAVFFVEGEKCVDAARKLGVPATTNPMGAGKWWPELTAHFRDADIVIIPDNDPVGKKHAQKVGEEIHKVARRVRILELSVLAGLAAKEDIYDWVQAGGTAAALYEMVERHAVLWDARLIVSAFGAIPWWELDKPADEHAWLIKGLLTLGERSMIAGPSQSGKSFLALDMALAVARGIPYWGRPVEHGGVLYQAGEGARGLKKRARAYRLHHGISPQERLPFILMPGSLDLHNGDEHLGQFIEEGKRWTDMFGAMFELPLRLVVIDTFATATPGANENDGADMSRVLARCARISETLKTHVMLVHHMNASGQKPRGHTSIFANLENVILLERHTEKTDGDGRPIREARLAKQKDGEDGTRWRFVLRGGVEVGRDADGDPITSCVVVPPDGCTADIGGGPGVVAGKYKGRLTDRQEIAMRALQDALIEHGRAAPRALGLPAGTRVVEWAQWRVRWARVAFDDEGEVQKESKRIGRSLLTRRLIGKDGNWVWIVHGDESQQEAAEPGHYGEREPGESTANHA